MDIDNDMSQAKRAGDMRRMLTAVLHYAEDDLQGLGQVMHEAHTAGRGQHFTFAALETLRDAYQLREHPERKDEIRRMIAQFTAVEHGDDERNET
jgi:hypothetical protein